MATLDFPTATPGATYTGGNGVTYTYDGTAGVWLASAAAAAGGKILQVVQSTFSTQISTSSSAWTDTGLSASITPSNSSNKILVTASMAGIVKDTGNTSVACQLLRGATSIIQFGGSAGQTSSNQTQGAGNLTSSYLDSPSTTSSTTYKVQYASINNIAQAYINYVYGSFAPISTLILMEVAA